MELMVKVIHYMDNGDWVRFKGNMSEFINFTFFLTLKSLKNL